MNEVFERLKTALAGTYTVERSIGEGGMAFIFLATDIKHDRSVAIKVLRPELTASLGAERFLNEIQITAGLQHPHILPLYDSGEVDGLLYYVMPLVEGETLAEYIAREKQLSIDEAIQIAREVAEALGHAHSHGLIHRDIKPDNVMMSGGHAVVADFGIAKAVSVSGGQKLTQSGMAIGTPAYMSPEQAAGDPDIDGRTDIYALGCMLYEMLVGEIPFTGRTSQAILARHTMDIVSPPSTVRQSASPDLEDIVFCSMAKSPADRFRTASEMIDALKAVEIGSRPKIRSTQTRAIVARSVVRDLGTTVYPAVRVMDEPQLGTDNELDGPQLGVLGATVTFQVLQGDPMISWPITVETDEDGLAWVPAEAPWILGPATIDLVAEASGFGIGVDPALGGNGPFADHSVNVVSLGTGRVTFGAMACGPGADVDGVVDSDYIFIGSTLANLSPSGTLIEFFYSYDCDNLYFAVRIEADEALNNSVRVEFDKDNDGVATAGNDVLRMLRDKKTGLHKFTDRHLESRCVNRNGQSDCSTEDSQSDGEGDVNFDGTTFTYEMSHPLSSGDGEDFELHFRDSIGFWVAVSLGKGTQGNTEYPDFRQYKTITIGQ